MGHPAWGTDPMSANGGQTWGTPYFLLGLGNPMSANSGQTWGTRLEWGTR